ncbi:DSD1 family PLP-dependent enzyme [Massilia cavernae]|uniref:DSD1 family PLP-dependent enzyme n=1 Tax=Massilia cavernae TaxID=2320864 RepID=A0A418XGT0_9BURK|nr:DSD1 family PLP-dependent enzyme [Massilia cavernae]RJG11672.1 DSD1 family PLP-dependent enzyme [Massilia cavernae]
MEKARLDPMVETPALLLDRQRMDRNIARMRAHLSTLGVQMRPHVKTNKCLEVARRLFDDGCGPITVSTLREARFFFEHGFTDILYGVAIAPNKFAQAAELVRMGASLTLVLDSMETTRQLAAYATDQRQKFDVLLEIDCDGHRSGLAPDSPLIVEIAHALRLGGIEVKGVMTHAGNSYNSKSIAQIEAYACQERDAVLLAAKTLRNAGFAAPVVSVGSTPTALFAKDLTGVTEVRAGVFVFFDLVMAGLGVCQLSDIALSVLTTVIGHQPEKGWTIVDAGWMALSRDRGTASQAVDQGYGVVCDVHGAPLPDMIVVAANQEHGIVAARDGCAGAAAFPVGTQLRIFPNHACATAAQHGGYHVTGDQVPSAYWPRFGGW